MNKLFESVILPIGDFVQGLSVHSQLDFLNRSQFWSRSQLNDYQDVQLIQLIKHAYENVPYYNDIFKKLKLTPDDIKTKQDLVKLPILTKEAIKKNGSQKFAARNISQKKMITNSSSGSTGEPLQFYQTRLSESFSKAAAIRSWYWMGYRLGDRYVKLSMNPRKPSIKKIQDFTNNCKYISTTQLTHEEFNKIIDEIVQFDPKYIRCYPTPLLFLAQQLRRRNIFGINSLEAINTTGTTLHIAARNDIESVFHKAIYDSYSCEGGTVFAQCENRDNYHPAEECAISEFIADDFTNNDPDQAMRHITTDLTNWAFPFIRYDTQDYISLGSKTPCSCGRNYINIAKIKGRDSDILITPSGKYFISEHFAAYFEWIMEVEQYQVLQEKMDNIIINLVVNEKYSTQVRDKLYDYWSGSFGNDVSLIIRTVNSIPLTPTGKRRNVIRNPNIKIS